MRNVVRADRCSLVTSWVRYPESSPQSGTPQVTCQPKAERRRINGITLARILLIFGLLGCGSAFGDSISMFDCNQSPFFAWSSIIQVVDSYCTNGPLTFTFDTPLSDIGINSANYVYVDGSIPLTSPNSPGLSFFGSTDGTLGDSVTSDVIEPIEVQFSVSVTAGEPFVIESSDVDHLINGGSSGTIGGEEKFCVGALFSGASFADDGCVANGGVLYSNTLASGNAVSFAGSTTLVDVWDEITFGDDASFGQIGQTFAVADPAPGAPEPQSLVLIGCGLCCIGLLHRRWKRP